MYIYTYIYMIRPTELTQLMQYLQKYLTIAKVRDRSSLGAELREGGLFRGGTGVYVGGKLTCLVGD